LRERFLVFLILAVLACPAVGWPTKLVRRTFCTLALAPVDLRLERSGGAAPGQTFRLTLTATAAVACPDTTLELTIPAGATLVSGATQWTGPLGEAETRTLVVDVSVPDNARRRFEGAVEVRSGTSVLPRTAIHDVGAAPSAPSIQSMPEEMTPDGVRIMVLPAREVSP
jgi:hypothetical protein